MQMMTQRKYTRLLAVDLEPTPYKVDLWNAFAASKDCQIEVLYTNAKDSSKDAGHNYQELPHSQFSFRILLGHSVFATLQKMAIVGRTIASIDVNAVYIAGYVNAAPLIAIIGCTLLKKPFFVHSDIFNNLYPKPPLSRIKKWIRSMIRGVVFKHASAVLVCGKLGIESALTAGCSQDKVIDFPYVIERKRLLSDFPAGVPADLLKDLSARKVVIYFSGRMIARKGLGTSFEALASLESKANLLAENSNWIVWIGGDGPLLSQYKDQAHILGIHHRMRFLGFVQMQLHSWMLRHADIILVPSLADSWGIVVDEGMQLGKPVIASSGVGSAIDRIIHGENGMLFAPGDAKGLADQIESLLGAKELRRKLGSNALMRSQQYSPSHNVAVLMERLR